MKKRSSFVGPALIILAAVFWGSMGIFVRRLTSFGFTSIQITSGRLTLGSLIFCAVLLLRDPKGFRIHKKDIPLFLGLGLASVLFFTVCYFMAITMMPLSTAAILLYTSPIWIMLMSVLFFREKLIARKLLALALAFFFAYSEEVSHSREKTPPGHIVLACVFSLILVMGESLEETSDLRCIF